MNLTATKFLKQATHTAEHFGFQPLDRYNVKLPDTIEPLVLSPNVAELNSEADDLHGLLTIGTKNYLDYNLYGLERSVLFYTIEEVPAVGGVALSLQIFGVEKSIAELVLMKTSQAIAEELHDYNYTVRVNSLGDQDSNLRYEKELKNFFGRRINELPSEARTLIKESPLNTLMYLIEKDHELVYQSPHSMEYLNDSSRRHFREIIEYLDISETPYEIDTKLLGHNGCYSDVLFAIDFLDRDNQVIAKPTIKIRGGRYNTFTEKTFNQVTPAVGAVIICTERPMPQRTVRPSALKKISVYVIQLGFKPRIRSLLLIDDLRRVGVSVRQDLTCDSLSEQLREAERESVQYTVIIGQKECFEETVILRDMSSQTQKNVPMKKIVNYLCRLKKINHTA